MNFYCLIQLNCRGGFLKIFKNTNRKYCYEIRIVCVLWIINNLSKIFVHYSSDDSRPT